MEKMKVIPVNVPWMISPSYEIDKYYGGISFVSISLYCINSPKQQNKEIDKLNKLYNNDIPDDIWNGIGYTNIEIHFEPINYFGIVYPWQEVFGLDEQKYDISILKPYYDGTLDLNDVWNEKGICPDSKMYEVQNSVLKESLNITDNLIKHWLIIGHEEEIHILSKGFVWKEMP